MIRLGRNSEYSQYSSNYCTLPGYGPPYPCRGTSFVDRFLSSSGTLRLALLIRGPEVPSSRITISRYRLITDTHTAFKEDWRSEQQPSPADCSPSRYQKI